MNALRVVLHAHSTWSYDGRWPLDRIARIYGWLGVDAVMMTEHDTGFDVDRFPEYRAECARASTSHCTLIPGIEYSCPDNDIHILTWGLSSFLAEHRPVLETLQNVRRFGGVAVMAHPVRRSAWRKFDPDWVPYLSGIELWNRKSDGLVWGFEALNMIRQTGLAATVGQDFHRLSQIYPLTHRFTIPDAALVPVDLEAVLVADLAAGRSEACAFRRRLLVSDEGPRPTIHPYLERMRRRLRGILRG